MGERLGRLARRWWALGLAGHMVTLGIVLLALVPLMDVGTAFSPDEGYYGAQVEALQNGTWVVPSDAGGIDPEVEFPRWRGTRVDNGFVVYDRHPAYPRLLQGIASVGSGINWAILVTGLGGALAASAGAWCLSREVRADSERLAFWLVAASPVAINGYVLWAHAPAAGAASWAAVFLVRAMRRRRALPWLACALSLTAGLLLRSESVLYAAGLVAAVGMASLAWRRVDLLLGSAFLALTTGGGLLVERAVIAGITTASNQNLQARGVGSLGPDRGFLAGRIDGLQQTLVDGASYSEPRSRGAQLGVSLLVVGVILLTRRGKSVLAVGTLVLGSGLVMVRLVSVPEDPVPGLLIAWPMALAGVVGAVRHTRRREGPTAVLLCGAALAFLAVLATQYASGGAVNWGGRLVTIFVPILAVFASGSWSVSWRLDRRAWGGILVVASLVFTMFGFASLRSRRGTFDDISDAIRAQDVELAITPIRSIPQALWRDKEQWMTVGVGALEEALAVADAGGVDEVAVLWPTSLPLDDTGWRAENMGPVAGSTFYVTLYRLIPDER